MLFLNGTFKNVQLKHIRKKMLHELCVLYYPIKDQITLKELSINITVRMFVHNLEITLPER